MSAYLGCDMIKEDEVGCDMIKGFNMIKWVECDMIKEVGAYLGCDMTKEDDCSAIEEARASSLVAALGRWSSCTEVYQICNIVRGMERRYSVQLLGHSEHR